MPRRSSRLSICLLSALFALLPLAAPRSASAGPAAIKVGAVRVIFSKRGINLRSKKSTLGKPIATLGFGDRLKVLAVQPPWLRVRTLPKAGQQAQTGWLRAWETLEPSALATPDKPAHLTSAGSAGVSSREVSAAGRQLDEGTEQRHRASRKELARAYTLVDRMEAQTAALAPADALGFIDEGRLGGPRADYMRPGRVKAAPRTASRRRRSKGIGGLLGGLGGEAARRLGAGRTGARVAESLIQGAAEFVDQVKVQFTPQQEYYLGRAVAAEAIARYGVDTSQARRRYVRLVGEVLVRTCTRLPANFGGYHFEVLDSDEVNGVSGPGGFVLVTRGAVEACQSEAELAGILAHELDHIRAQHGEKLLRKNREFPGFVKGLGRAAGAAAGNNAFAAGLTRFFGQVVNSMAGTAMSHGYGQAFEFAADRGGTLILSDVWYDHTALRTLLGRLVNDAHRHVRGATHASPQVRVQALNGVIAKLSPFKAPQPVRDARLGRFHTSLGRSAPLPK